MPSSATIWELDPHTAKKHEILRRYFQAWLPIMSRWNGRVVYIDGFAGPGKYSGGEEGSPLIVLKAARDHAYPIKAELLCLFIEKDEKRAAHLQEELKALKPPLPSNIKFEVASGAFDEHLNSVFQTLDEQNKKLAPTFAFIDPFGFSHTPFHTVERILKNPKCEVLVNLMYEEVNRFLRHPDHPETYNALFGCEGWKAAIDVASPEERRNIIHNVYLDQLRKTARYVRSFEMLNFGNRTDYFLFFATNSVRGLEKMKEAMWAVDKSGAFQFSDYTESLGTQSLFGDEPDYADLRNRILAKFTGQEILIASLEDWVISSTPYLRTHIKKIVLRGLEQDELLSVHIPGKQRRKGTFPEGSILRFS